MLILYGDKSDVLNRHEASHDEGNERSVTTASSRACRQCAIGRVRCTRGQPCKRCLDRRLLCRYPPSTLRSQVRAQDHGEGTHDGEMQQANSILGQVDARVSRSTVDAGLTPLVDPGEGVASAPLLSAMGYSGDSLAWTGTVGGIEGLYDINPPGVSVSGVNWMSPQYELAIDWDALLASCAVEGSAQQGTHADESPQSDTHPKLQQQTQPDLVSAGIRSRSIVGSAESSTSTDGRYYVDGSGARAPFGGRSHNRDSIGAIETMHEPCSDEAMTPHPVRPVADLLCSTAAYDILVQTISTEYQLGTFDVNVTDFPSHLQLQHYVCNYFRNFHPIFPFVRQSAFGSNATAEPLLLLAVSLVGSNYTRRLHGKDPSETLLRMLGTILQRRRYGYRFDSNNGEHTTPSIPGQSIEAHTCPTLQLLQAGILNIVCMMHSGKRGLVEQAFIERHFLVEACHALDLISRVSEDDSRKSTTPYHGYEAICDWVKHETEVRTGMMIWVSILPFPLRFITNRCSSLTPCSSTSLTQSR
jgi:hypothetical protein